MKLYGTPLSHFTRKTRILLDLYSVPYDFLEIGNVAEGDQETFAGNPLMKIPVLVDGAEWLIESDHIAQYIVRKVDPSDRYRVLSPNIWHLNIRAVLNGLMTEEVKYILAKRTSVPVQEYEFFTNALEAMINSFDWLEQNSNRFNVESPGYTEFHLACAFEHVAWYRLFPLEYPRLRAIVDRVLEDETVSRTSPR